MEIIKDIFFFSAEKPLLFTQLFFWLFFAVMYAFYSILYPQKTLRNAYLFLISIFFYYKSSGFYFFLLIFSTLSDYTLGLLIHSAKEKFYKKIYLILSIVINLSLLAYFKYSYFFTDIINSIFNVNIEVVNLFAGLANQFTGRSFSISEIILPVGISFYTFQTISYTVDVYRKKVEPVKNIIDFGFYVSFFPQLVAGPIVRASEFIPQLYQKFQLSKAQFGHALFLILAGLIKKIAISDYISINFVDRVFDNPLSFTGFENLMAVYGYALQIYCDFSGYTDIAIGVALLMGFRLPLNFNSPYKAVNITDFWRRWHISLSRWLKDYLYIPLGGNRKGKTRTYINLMITMLLGGLWHGANWRFVIWGGIHGLGLAIHKLFIKYKLFKIKNSAGKKLSVFLTFQLISFSWIFFRAKDLQTVKYIFSQLVTNFRFDLIGKISFSYYKVFTLVLIGFVLHWLPYSLKEKVRGKFIHTHMAIKILLTLLVILFLYQIKSSELQPFIYFQF